MSDTTPSISPATAEVHYWETVVFVVEGSYFKVPKYHFMKSSEIFQSMFSLPQSGENVEGTDTNPIKLDGVKAVDFRRFLDSLYPSNVPWDLSRKTNEEWQSILKLATLWRFLHLRQVAIDKLTRREMDAVESILLGREFSVSRWIQTGYTTLVVRSEALTMEEVETIGYGHAIQVFRAREEARRRQEKDDCYYCGRSSGPGVNAYQAQNVVETEFATEIAQASCDGAEYNLP